MFGNEWYTSDHKDRDGCLYDNSIQNINSYEYVSGTAPYNTVLISQHFNVMLAKFMYCKSFFFFFL